MGAALVCTEWRRLTLDSELWSRINESDGYDTLMEYVQNPSNNLRKNEAELWNRINQYKKTCRCNHVHFDSFIESIQIY